MKEARGGNSVNIPETICKGLDVSKSVNQILKDGREEIRYRVVLYGAGNIGKRLKKEIDEKENIQVVAWVDSDYRSIITKGNSLQDIHVISQLDYDYVIIAVLDRKVQEEIQFQLAGLGVDEKKILYYLRNIEGSSKYELLLGLQKEECVREFVTEYLMRETELDESVYKEIENLAYACERVRKGKKYDNREWYLDKHSNAAYLRIAKAACTSIIKSIRKADGTISVHKEASKGLLIEDSLDDMDIFKFTYVRNPFARIVSCYNDKINGREVSLYKNKNYGLGIFDTDKGFASFVNQVVKIPDQWADRHFRSQYSYIYDEQGKCLVDYIGKVEDLPADFEKISVNYHLNPLEHLNASRKGDWRTYYTQETADKVYEYYKKDIMAFGYESSYKELLLFLKSCK